MSAFVAGERVHVRRADAPGHIRTPQYVRGKTGVVAGLVGVFENPEELAWGRHGDRRALYRVRFERADLFGADGTRDEVDVEIFEHWLERA